MTGTADARIARDSPAKTNPRKCMAWRVDRGRGKKEREREREREKERERERNR